MASPWLVANTNTAQRPVAKAWFNPNVNLTTQIANGAHTFFLQPPNKVITSELEEVCRLYSLGKEVKPTKKKEQLYWQATTDRAITLLVDHLASMDIQFNGPIGGRDNFRAHGVVLVAVGTGWIYLSCGRECLLRTKAPFPQKKKEANSSDTASAPSSSVQQAHVCCKYT